MRTINTNNQRQAGGVSLRWLMLLLALVAFPVVAATTVPLAWNVSTNANIGGYKIYFGPASRTYTNAVDVGNVTNTVIAGLAAGTTYYFAATTYDTAGVESAFSNEATYTTTNAVTDTNSVPPVSTFQPPTLDPLADISLKKNASAQAVSLTGISAGSAGAQAQSQSHNQKNKGNKLKITASSSNPKVVGVTKVSYTSPDSTGSLKLKPKAAGSAIITVTVSGGVSNSVVTRSFTVTVLPPATAAVTPQANVAVNNATAATAPLIPAPLESVSLVNGHFTFTVNGVAGNQYVVQASSDLANWTTVQTNTAPFVFTEENASATGKMFYRAFGL
jgi:hypothetical protein